MSDTANYDRPFETPNPPATDAAGPAGPSVLLPDGSPARPAASPPRVRLEIHELGEAARVHLGETLIEGSPEDLVAIIQILSKAALGCFQRRFAIQQKLMADMQARAQGHKEP